ncbi:hypothetical protein J3F83DRAFT_209638 [Trichoderma novae-zelandiae]
MLSVPLLSMAATEASAPHGWAGETMYGFVHEWRRSNRSCTSSAEESSPLLHAASLLRSLSPMWLGQEALEAGPKHCSGNGTQLRRACTERSVVRSQPLVRTPARHARLYAAAGLALAPGAFGAKPLSSTMNTFQTVLVSAPLGCAFTLPCVRVNVTEKCPRATEHHVPSCQASFVCLCLYRERTAARASAARASDGSLAATGEPCRRMASHQRTVRIVLSRRLGWCRSRAADLRVLVFEKPVRS